MPTGTLYLVTTPIGNLSDISERVVSTLREADLVAAEDTRRARQLLSHLGLHKPLESFHGDSDDRKTAKLVRVLETGQSVAYVSDGGVPGISDPGRELVIAAVQAGATVVPIPGPCALTTALSVSGMVADRFVFGGFPPRKAGELREFLEQIGATGLTVVLYEAPRRVVETLQAVAEVFGDAEVVAARELTKQYEELLRGTASELAQRLTEREPRGEFVLVIQAKERVEGAIVSAEQVEAAVSRLTAAGVGAKDIAEVMSGLGAAPRRQAYQMALKMRKELEERSEK
ncbi:MAG: 16S rRNA (cytidine(1402)-2'-O)-methyltransferase [Armatimonadota bacterium]